MKLTDKPRQIAVPFASGTVDKNTIPNNATQETKEKGNAAYDSGFPPLTMTAIAAGGIPPHGKDFNGLLNDITAAIRFSQAGGQYTFDSAFAKAIGGYAKGATVLSAGGSKIWWSTVDANTTDPDGASAVGWKDLLADPEGLFLQKAQNLADLQNKAEGRKNLELGTAATKDIGITTNTVAAGDDSRFLAGLPTGVPLPWPADTPPTGYMVMRGQEFNKAQYPQLAIAYPSGKVPDMRGLMIKHPSQGRNLLSTEDDGIKSHTHGGRASSTHLGVKGTSPHDYGEKWVSEFDHGSKQSNGFD
ncbi:phage tail protein, partial [Serratia liquefaciens]|uniref:phage tail protein n=1 Tax=Serratia liquefaciens TaxID=614 RepID=UPI00390648C7